MGSERRKTKGNSMKNIDIVFITNEKTRQYLKK